MINVLLVDDKALVRAGLKQILVCAKGIKIVAEADSGEEAIAFAKEMSIDVTLMDTRMPGMGSLETCRRLLMYTPDSKIVMVADRSDALWAARFLQLGIVGYLTRSGSVEELYAAVRKAYVGQSYITADVAQRLAMKHVKGSCPIDGLTERELQIFEMVTHGKGVKEISDTLCLSPKTVNSHRYRLFSKLKLDNDVELTHLALRSGLLVDLHLSVDLATKDDNSH